MKPPLMKLPPYGGSAMAGPGGPLLKSTVSLLRYLRTQGVAQKRWRLLRQKGNGVAD